MKEVNHLLNDYQLQELITNIANQFSSQEKDKYGKITLSEVATNLLTAIRKVKKFSLKSKNVLSNEI